MIVYLYKNPKTEDKKKKKKEDGTLGSFEHSSFIAVTLSKLQVRVCHFIQRLIYTRACVNEKLDSHMLMLAALTALCMCMKLSKDLKFDRMWPFIYQMFVETTKILP